jgi:site-specific DNA recombinase
MSEIKPIAPQTNRAVIYARFSTDLQNERSIDDQVALCRSYAERNGLDVVAVFDDRAVSGASIHQRTGIQKLLIAARERRFDVVIAETMSRVGRDEEDRAAIRKRLTFAGINMMTPVDGVVTRLTDGIKAVIDSQYLEDLKVMIRRGMAGVVRDGRHAGGKAYGYRSTGKKGILEIDPGQAEIVLGIFTEYVAGRTPRDIAHDLNGARVMPPRGRSWNASTINGNMQRGTGILQNELYIGRVVWNKVRMVKDPDTGKRVSRPNPKSAWQVTEVPALAIVSRELFSAAQSRKEARTRTHPNEQRRPRHLLSGLLRCGTCGAGMSTNGKDRSGRIRVRCSAAYESGICPDPKTFYLQTIENAVLGGLKVELQHPRVIAEYVRAYHEERHRLRAEGDLKRSRLEQRIGELQREIDRVVDAIAKGHGEPSVLGPRSTALDEERKKLVLALDAEAPTTDVVSLHPAVLARYEQQLSQLQEALSKGVRAGDSDAAEAIRELVETVTVSRDPSRIGGVAVKIVGRLNALLGDAAYPNKVKGVWGKMVARSATAFPLTAQNCAIASDLSPSGSRGSARGQAWGAARIIETPG